MIEVRQTSIFRDWLAGLRDQTVRARIAARIDRLAEGKSGDAKAVGAGVSELRLDFGPGYRLYFTRVDAALLLLLCGGDKSTQEKDIARAKALARDMKHDD